MSVTYNGLSKKARFKKIYGIVLFGSSYSQLRRPIDKKVYGDTRVDIYLFVDMTHYFFNILVPLRLIRAAI